LLIAGLPSFFFATSKHVVQHLSEDGITIEHPDGSAPICAGVSVAKLMFHQSVDQSLEASDPFFQSGF
jgi:hypothetical protein